MKSHRRAHLRITAVFFFALLFIPIILSTGTASANAPLPDWSQAGYRGTGNLPSSGEITSNNNCIITTTEIQASPYNVIPNDGNDDSAGIQAAIDAIGNNCSGSFSNLSLIELPSGTLNTSTEIHVDVDYLIIRGQGNNPANSSATKIEFEPGSDTVYDGISDFDLNGMTDSGGGKGGWIWPGRGAFRVQTRAVDSSYNSAYSSAPANRKDFYEGSVNFHWKGGIEVAQNSLIGDTVLELASISGISVGDYVWVGAANSHKMYDRQGVQSGDRLRGHMRQQIFVVTAVNSGSKTITIDKPLEFDLYINSTADGSSEISGSGSANKSKVIPLTVVQGVGLENFYLTQIVPGHAPSEAVFNYNNIAKEQAVHGMVFKWAVDSYAKDVRTYMTGSHPIVTEMSKNLQFEDNYFEGSWNKGKGGNGYFRNSKLWDSLIKNNTTIGLRHLTLQWSASGNVVTGNTLDSDINLHGGWERYNLIENNIVNIPFNHRDCNPNCSGGEGTWYPIWWAAGYHAGGWSGATGPQNVFFNNTLRKQLSAGGAYTDYAPYGTNANTVYQFGWDRNTATGSEWVHLAINGTDIETWTHNETVNFLAGTNVGVNAECTFAGSSLIGASITCGGVTQPTNTPTSIAPTSTTAPPTSTPDPSVSLKVQYEVGDSSATDNAIKPNLRIVNEGNTAVSLNQLTMRYWFTESTGGFNYTCDYATLGCGNINGQVISAGGNSYYLEVGFTTGAGTVAAGAHTGNMKHRVNQASWGNFDETDDYSYDPSKSSYSDWNQVTLYQNGTLIWGIEPGGSPIPTNTPIPPTATSPAPTATNTAVPPTATSPAPTATTPATGNNDIEVQAKVTKDEANKTQYDVKILNNGSTAFSGYSFRVYIDISEILSAGYSANDLRCDENYDASGSGSCSFAQYSGTIYYADVDFGNYSLSGNDDVRYKFTIRLNGWASGIDSSNDYSRQGLSSSYQTTDKIPVYQGNSLVNGTNP